MKTRDQPVRGHVEDLDDLVLAPYRGDERAVGAEGRAPCSAVSRHGREEPASRRIPHLQPALIAGGGELRAVAAERHAPDVVVTLEREDALSRLVVPDVDNARVLGAPGHEDPGGAPGHKSPQPGHLQYQS